MTKFFVSIAREFYHKSHFLTRVTTAARRRADSSLEIDFVPALTAH